MRFGRAVTALLVACVVVLAALPLAMDGGARFAGTDDAARQAILEIDSTVEPWFRPLWSPPSAEVEGFLFALQAAIGGAVIGYFFGLKRGKAGRDRPKQ